MEGGGEGVVIGGAAFESIPRDEGYVHFLLLRWRGESEGGDTLRAGPGQGLADFIVTGSALSRWTLLEVAIASE